MQSPFASSTAVPGSGTVHLTLLPPSKPSFSVLQFTYPLKLISSSPHILPPIDASAKAPNSDETDSATGEQLDARRPSTVPLLFLLTYGGGLLSNDHIQFSLTLDPFTRLTMATQGSTKIFKVPTTPTPLPLTSDRPQSHMIVRAVSSQTLKCILHPHASIFYSPHPTQPFASSRYAQVQIFDLHQGASLGLLDWVSEGRRARGESWDFEGWRGRNEVWTVKVEKDNNGKNAEPKRKLLLRDSVILEGRDIKMRMENLGIFGTLILVGPLLQSLADFFVSEFAALPRIGGRNWDSTPVAPALSSREKWRLARQTKEKDDGVVWTTAKVRDDRAVVVKFGARDVHGAREWLGAMLKEEGSVAREFGEGALMGVG